MSIKGEKGIVYIWDTNAYKPIACLTSNSLETNVSIIESQTKCFPGVVKKTPGSFNGKISLEGEYIDTTSVGGDTAKKSHDELLVLQIAKTKITWKLDTNIDEAGSIKYYGDAYITDLSAEFGSGDNVSTFSSTFEVDGAISQTDPND